jgi:hypothetical protein
MLNIRQYAICIVLLIATCGAEAAQPNVNVGTAAELLKALKTSGPGMHIVLSDGDYDLNTDVKISAAGKQDSPIVIKALHRGMAKIVGSSHFILTGAEHFVIEGLTFESMNGPAIDLRGCNNIRITRNTFHLKETERASWVVIDGIAGDSVRLSHHNRIDHNLFERKSLLGNFITVEGTMRAVPQMSQYDRIDHNLFTDIGPRVENVLEAIRCGSARYSLSSAFTVIEANLFERCDGDPEYISIKSSDDTIRHNTFRECLGSLSLRHGNRNTVDGNYVLGNGRTGTFLDSTGKTWTLGTGGVRFYGTGMRIINNYFEGLTGTRWDATFAITSGNAQYGDGQPLTKHFRIKDATIANNTLVNNASNFEIGYDGGGFQGNWWHLPPIGLRIERNVIVGSKDTLVHIFNAPEATHWNNNIVWPTGAAAAVSTPIQGVLVADPHLEKVAGIWSRQAEVRRPRPLERTDVGPDAE